jgi:ribosomal protein S18 acetylase RimI-like enzyme
MSKAASAKAKQAEVWYALSNWIPPKTDEGYFPIDEPVTKHANHNQKDHGKWATGRSGRKATVQTETYGEYVEVQGVTTADGQRFKASTGGDAVPGGYNGFISLTSDTGEQAGRIDYQMLTGEAADRYGTDLTIGMVEVSPSFQRRGLGTALVDALRATFPGEEINIGYQTDDGAKLH